MWIVLIKRCWHIFGFKTIKEACCGLNQYFLYDEEMSIECEWLKLKEIGDQLKYAKYVLIEKDKVLYLVASLDRDYEEPIATTSGRLQIEIVLLVDASIFLLGRKSWLESYNEITCALLPYENMVQ